MSGPGYALEPGEAEANERHDARGDTSPGYYSEPRACAFCTGSGSHCPECSDDEGDSPYCRCDDLPTLGEVNRNRCDNCERPLK